MSDDNYLGRRMSKCLQDAIDNAPDRRITAQVFAEYAQKPGSLSEIYRGIAVELMLAGMREADELARLEYALTLPEPDEEPTP